MDKEVEKEIKAYENYTKLLENRNRIGKNNFIKEINGGLGEDIKNSLMKEKNKGGKIKKLLNKIFKIF